MLVHAISHLVVSGILASLVYHCIGLAVLRRSWFNVVLADDRPGAPAANVLWAGNLEEVGMILHGYQSAWIPVSLLQDDQQGKLVDSLFAAVRHWEVVPHVNKGLAGGANEAIDAAKNTA